MKHLLLSLALILSANTWTEDEFPIELTCEAGTETIFLFLNETREGSWFKFDKSNTRPGGLGYELGKRYFFKKKYEFDKKTIHVTDGTFVNITGFTINRYSLRMLYAGPNNYHVAGQCYKGFKEYEKQI